MKAKPINDPLHLIKLVDITSWDSYMLVPSSMLSEFAVMLNRIRNLNSKDAGNGGVVLLDRGPTTFTSEPLNAKKHVVMDDEAECQQFIDFHKATLGVLAADKPSYGALVCTLEDFHANNKPTITE